MKLPGEIESKDERSQMCLENNLNKIKNSFCDIFDKYWRFFKYIANKGKTNIYYEMLWSKIADINFYDKYDTLYEYLNHLLGSSVEKNYFWKIFQKGLA